MFPSVRIVLRNFSAFFLLIVAFSCIDPIDFSIKATSPPLVVEAFISDKSFNETKEYPSDGRYFSVKLTYASDVKNIRSVGVQNAEVSLLVDDGHEFHYSESAVVKGLYELQLADFRAELGKKYQLRIVAQGSEYRSTWESLPLIDAPPMGNIDFVENEKQAHVFEAGNFVIKPVKQITATLQLGKNTSNQPIHYRWSFSPTWVYIAPFSPSVTRPGYICWATDKNYIRDFALQTDYVGGYTKELFSIPTIRNERIFEDLSVLVVQHVLDDRNFQFWNEMFERNGRNTLMDKPPYNLISNLQSIHGTNSVTGYFGVVKEQARRWYFNKDQLSYYVKNTLRDDCSINYGPPLPGCPEPLPSNPACECKYCLDYSFGETTNVKPTWWNPNYN